MHEGAETADVIIMAAAVADYRPAEVQPSKIKKEDQGDTLDLRLVRNPDILKELSGAKKSGQVIIGFAAETEQDRNALLELGRAKILRKGADLLVLNTVGWTEGFASEDNTVVVIDRAGDIVGEAAGNKLTVAERILDLLP
jgi:phosphopantothenoylcysteine decarboxylase/phosphopantothenate--cysteine ligase